MQNAINIFEAFLAHIGPKENSLERVQFSFWPILYLMASILFNANKSLLKTQIV